MGFWLLYSKTQMLYTSLAAVAVVVVAAALLALERERTNGNWGKSPLISHLQSSFHH
jgi:hypothetical protein